MRSPHSAALLVATAGLAMTAACSGGGTTAKGASPTPTPSPTASPTPAPTKVAPAPVDLLTGTSPRSKGTLVGIKVDNAFLAQPYQTGLGQAAVVYQELVEGGLTRLLAVFESDHASAEVGPIRSVRESDIELVREFGKITLGFSGGQGGVLAVVHAAQRAGFVADASYDAVPGAYRLGAQRRDARNFFAVPSRLASLRPGGAVRDIGLRFGPQPGGTPSPVVTAGFSPASRVVLRWSAATRAWSVTQNGHLMPGVAPVNVILQRVLTRGSGFKDIHGNTTPYNVTTGTGSATVLRDGKRYVGTWRRRGGGPTHFLDRAGKDLHLQPGRTWILLVPTSGSVS